MLARDPRLAPVLPIASGCAHCCSCRSWFERSRSASWPLPTCDPAASFTDDQVRFAAALATSGSLAIENAHSYEIEHRTAETLRKLLAFPVPELPTLRIGAAHRAAAAAERVGGDFFDIFALDEHTVALFIADVSGKGVRAAGFTETVRSAMRALTYIDPSPAFVLDHVNESLMRQAADGCLPPLPSL